jgi:hypothetical protein
VFSVYTESTTDIPLLFEPPYRVPFSNTSAPNASAPVPDPIAVAVPVLVFTEYSVAVEKVGPKTREKNKTGEPRA